MFAAARARWLRGRRVRGAAARRPAGVRPQARGAVQGAGGVPAAALRVQVRRGGRLQQELLRQGRDPGRVRQGPGQLQGETV